MSTITITKLHALLSQKLGSETAENLTTFITEKIKEDVEYSTKEIATKDFVAKEISHLETKMESGFKDQLKWIIILFIGLYAAIILQYVLHR